MSAPRQWSAELLPTLTEKQRELYFETMAALKVDRALDPEGDVKAAVGAARRLASTTLKLLSALAEQPGPGADALLKTLAFIAASEPEGFSMLVRLAAPTKERSS
jgi:hypothetical protein